MGNAQPEILIKYKQNLKKGKKKHKKKEIKGKKKKKKINSDQNRKCPGPFAIVKKPLFSSPLKISHGLRNLFSKCSFLAFYHAVG